MYIATYGIESYRRIKLGDCNCTRT